MFSVNISPIASMKDWEKDDEKKKEEQKKKVNQQRHWWVEGLAANDLPSLVEKLIRLQTSAYRSLLLGLQPKEINIKCRTFQTKINPINPQKKTLFCYVSMRKKIFLIFYFCFLLKTFYSDVKYCCYQVKSYI